MSEIKVTLANGEEVLVVNTSLGYVGEVEGPEDANVCSWDFTGDVNLAGVSEDIVKSHKIVQGLPK